MNARVSCSCVLLCLILVGCNLRSELHVNIVEANNHCVALRPESLNVVICGVGLQADHVCVKIVIVNTCNVDVLIRHVPSPVEARMVKVIDDGGIVVNIAGGPPRVRQVGRPAEYIELRHILPGAEVIDQEQLGPLLNQGQAVAVNVKTGLTEMPESGTLVIYLSNEIAYVQAGEGVLNVRSEEAIFMLGAAE